MLLGGDWRQIPPVAKYVERAAVSSLTIAALPFWRNKQFHLCRLQENMRARDDHPYAEFCKTVGDGSLAAASSYSSDDLLSSACVDLPSAISVPCPATPADLLAWVFNGFETLQPAQWPQFYESRAVLAPTNDAADDLNNHMFGEQYRTTCYIMLPLPFSDNLEVFRLFLRFQ